MKNYIFWDVTSYSSMKVNWLSVEHLCHLLLHAGFFTGIFFDPEDGRGVFLRDISWHLPDNTVLYFRRYNSSQSLIREPHIQHRLLMNHKMITGVRVSHSLFELSVTFSDETEENHGNFSQNSLCHIQHLELRSVWFLSYGSDPDNVCLQNTRGTVTVVADSKYHIMVRKVTVKRTVLWRFERRHFRRNLWRMRGACFWYSKALELREESGEGEQWILYYLSQFTLQLECNKHSTPGHPPTRNQYKAECPSCSNAWPLTVTGSYSDAGCILSDSLNLFKLQASVHSLYRGLQMEGWMMCGSWCWCKGHVHNIT